MRRRGLATFLSMVVLVGLAPGARAGGEPTPPPPGAAEAVAALRSELGTALKAALPDGPMKAVDACRQQAPGITTGQQRPGIRVGRTSDRVRNPANAPEEWMLPLLETFRETPREPGAFRTVDLGSRGTGYVEPIYLQPLCATCHGASIAPALREFIHERYPEDRATGFAVGELRGLFWAVLTDDSALGGGQGVPK